MAATLYVSNDNNVTLQGYMVAATSAPVTDAQPSFTVFGNIGPDDTPLQGPVIAGLENQSMSYVAGSSGNYVGLIPGSSGLTYGSWYYVVVTFANYSDQFTGWFQATYRQSN
jgi:hypothetical protein